jgi:Tol biopolymer transport system component
MLTGRQAFPGETASDAIASILQREADWQALPATTPVKLRELLQRCLRKERGDRLHDIADARIEIDEVLSGLSGALTVSAGGHDGGPGLDRVHSWQYALLFLVGIGVGALSIGIWHTTLSPSEKIAKFSIVSQDRINTDSPVVVSPDGQSIAYVTSVRNDEGFVTSRIVTRRLDRFDETRLNGWISTSLEPAGNLFQNLSYSPDGHWLAFIGPLSPGSTERRLYKIEASGKGQPITLADLPANVRSILWIDDDTILGAAYDPPSILEFSARSGSAGSLLLLESGDLVRNCLRPTAVLPGGRYLLASADSYSEKGWQLNVTLLDMQTGELRFLTHGDNPLWSPTGHILFSRLGQLLAVGFSPDTGSITGSAVPMRVGAGVRPGGFGDGWFGMSLNGTLAYHAGGMEVYQRRIMLLDRDAGVDEWSEDRLFYDRLWANAVSPDGRWVVVEVLNWERGLQELWISDLKTPRLHPHAAIPGRDCTRVVWSPDSHALAYTCVAEAASKVFLKAVDGSDEAHVLFSPGP